MAKQKGRMPTIWKVDDELWRLIKPLIDADMPRKQTGRPPVDRRKVLDCIIHRMRSLIRSSPSLSNPSVSPILQFSSMPVLIDPSGLQGESAFVSTVP